jgi:hypothetical protein
MPKPGTGPNWQSTEMATPFSGARLRPPDSLPDAARRIFTDLVGSLPSGHFKAGDISLLCRYCEMAAVPLRLRVGEAANSQCFRRAAT